MTLDTGDNPNYKQSLIMKKAKDLVRTRGCKIIEPIADSRGRYAYQMRSADYIRFYLVARNTPPFSYESIVSTQLTLFEKALRDKKQIIMWWPEDYHVFNPKTIDKHRIQVNRRQGEHFLNFPAGISAVWTVETPLQTTVLRAMKKQMKQTQQKLCV